MKPDYIGRLVVTDYYRKNMTEIHYVLGIVISNDAKGYHHTVYQVQWLGDDNVKDTISFCTEDEIKTMMGKYKKYRDTRTGIFA